MASLVRPLSLTSLSMEILGLIMGNLGEYHDLTNFIRAGRKTWNAFWAQRNFILSQYIPRVIGPELHTLMVVLSQLPVREPESVTLRAKAVTVDLILAQKNKLQLPKPAELSRYLNLRKRDFGIRAFIGNYLFEKRIQRRIDEDPAAYEVVRKAMWLNTLTFYAFGCWELPDAEHEIWLLDNPHHYGRRESRQTMKQIYRALWRKFVDQ